MKQKLLFLCVLLLSSIAINAETFYTGFDGSKPPTGWTHNGSYITDRYQTAAPCIGFAANQMLTTSEFNNISAVDFYASRSSNGKNLTIAYSVNGTTFTTLQTLTSNDINTGTGPQIMKKFSLNATSIATISSLTNVKLRFTSSANTVYIDDITITYGATDAPTIIATPISLNAFSASTVEPASQTITVSGTNLTNDILLNITGTDAQYFSATPSSLTQTGGSVADTDVTVTYTPNVAGTHTATLTLASDGANSVTYNLSGTATLPTLATPVAKDATSITEKSFTANWDNVIGATEYQLSVSSVEGNTAPADGTKENPYSVADRRNGSATGVKWVTGYIVGVVKSSSTNPPRITLDSGPSFTTKTNIVLADSPTETDGSKLIAIQLSSNTPIYNALNLSDNPNNLGKGVKIYGSFENYFSDNPGVKSTSEYVLDVAIGATYTPIAGSPFTVTGANSYEVTGLQQNTNYVYSVIAKATGYNDSERSNEIAVKTIIVPEEVGSINQITDPNKFYKINEELEGVTKLGDLLIVKSGKGTHPNKTTQPATLQGDDDKDEFFEQASWISFSLPPTSENYVGKTIESGAVGKLNPTSGALEIAQITAPISKADAYNAFYTDKDNKYNCFRIKNFFPAIYGNYFIQPRHNEIAYITYVMYKEENGKKYFHDGTNQIEVKETYATIPAEAKNLGAGDGYSFKALFVKQPTVGRAISSEWALEFLEGGIVVTGVNDATINGDEANVIGANGAIEVFATDNNSINVYDLSGSIVRTVNNADSHTSINIPAGAYIVKVDNKVVKVIVR